MSLKNYFKVILGTYEEYLLGYVPDCDGDKVSALSPAFASHIHTASIRCVAVHGKYLASGGADEYIYIYDLVKEQAAFTITYHSSTITCLEFTNNGTHLISAAQDGTIAIFQCSNWHVVKVWKNSHNDSDIISMSIHNSNGLLMTTGGDKKIKFWNLVKGTLAYTVPYGMKCTKPGATLGLAKWSKDGQFHVVCYGNTFEVNSLDGMALVYKHEGAGRITCVDFEKDGILYVGMENGAVGIHNIESKKCLYDDVKHKSRIKCIESFMNESSRYIITADSNGDIMLWEVLIKKDAWNLKFQVKVESGCRITCMTIFFPSLVKEEEEENIDEDTPKKIISELKSLTNSEKRKVLNRLEEVYEKEVKPTSSNSSLVLIKNQKRKSDNKEFRKKKALKSSKRKKMSSGKWTVENVT